MKAKNKVGCISFDSYIKPQLVALLHRWRIRCISFDSYIKPQLVLVICLLAASCISFDSYIKPQLAESYTTSKGVVYLLIPTSNHNWVLDPDTSVLLYIF